jgi:nucleotide-binding universal stress UspA family protein
VRFLAETAWRCAWSGILERPRRCMFQRILVPLDGSPESNAALPAARTIAHATGASVYLLHVLESAEASANAATEKLNSG